MKAGGRAPAGGGAAPRRAPPPRPHPGTGTSRPRPARGLRAGARGAAPPAGTGGRAAAPAAPRPRPSGSGPRGPRPFAGGGPSRRPRDRGHRRRRRWRRRRPRRPRPGRARPRRGSRKRAAGRRSFCARVLRGGASARPCPPASPPREFKGPDGELLRLQDEAMALALEALRRPMSNAPDRIQLQQRYERRMQLMVPAEPELLRPAVALRGHPREGAGQGHREGAQVHPPRARTRRATSSCARANTATRRTTSSTAAAEVVLTRRDGEPRPAPGARAARTCPPPSARTRGRTPTRCIGRGPPDSRARSILSALPADWRPAAATDPRRRARSSARSARCRATRSRPRCARRRRCRLLQIRLPGLRMLLASSQGVQEVPRHALPRAQPGAAPAQRRRSSRAWTTRFLERHQASGPSSSPSSRAR